MGVDKAGMAFNGRTLLEHAQDLASAVTDRVQVCGPRNRYGPGAIEDVFRGQGPLAGIHAALKSTATQLNLILAVDTPFLVPEFLRFLVAEAESGGALVTVPFLGGRYQPLCAVYRKGFAPIAERALSAGRNKIDSLYAETTTRRITEAEIRHLAFDARMFENLNTPEDLQRARQRA